MTSSVSLNPASRPLEKQVPQLLSPEDEKATDFTLKRLQKKPVSPLRQDLSKDWILSPQDRGIQVHLAVKSGALERVMQLLTAGKISEEHLGQAVRLSIRNEQLPTSIRLSIFQALMKSGKILREDRSHAADQASTLCQWDIVRLLLGNGRILMEHLENVMYRAANQGLVDIVETVVVKAKGLISPQMQICTASNAAWHDYHEIVQLLRDKKISEQHQDLQLGHAILPNDWVVVDALSMKKHLSLEARGQAVLNSLNSYLLEASCLVIVESLLTTGQISVKDRGQAILRATQREFTCTWPAEKRSKMRLNIIKLLLKHGPMSQEDHNAATDNANAKGYAEVTKLLKKANIAPATAIKTS